MNAGAASPWDFLRTGARAYGGRAQQLSHQGAAELPAWGYIALHAPQEHLWRSGRLRWAMWSTLGEKDGAMAASRYSDPIRPVRREGPTSLIGLRLGGPLRVIKSFFRAGFCGIPSSE